MTRLHRILITSKHSTTTATTSPSSSKSSAAAAAAEAPQANSVESDFVVILAALLCALICVVGLISVARCAWLRHGSTNDNNSRTGRRQPSANKGLKKKILQSLPKYIYDSNSANGGTKSTDCAICLVEYVDGDEIRVLPQCGHGFHVHCIDTWLGSHSSCPFCRQILVVARCHKCGEFPAKSGVDVSTAPAVSAETRIKVKQDCGSAPSSSSSNTFLP